MALFCPILAFLALGCKTDKGQDELVSQTSIAPRFTLLSSQATGIKFKNVLLENSQINYFDNPYIYNGGGIAVGDINNDGLPDLYFVSNIFSNKLYLNKGNLSFEDISVKAGVEASRGFKTGVAMIDLNHDGWLDIYVCRSHHQDPAVRADFVYINNKDLTFTEKATAMGIHGSAYTTHVAFLDYDKDGDLDIYQINHPQDFDQGVRVRLKVDASQKLVRRTNPDSPDHSDHLYNNRGDGTFEDVSIQAGINNSAFGLSASLIDVNNDSYTDIYVANDFIEPDMLYVNNGNGTFSERLNDYFRHTSQNSMGSDFADFNNDGLDDLITLDMLAESNQRQKLMTTSMVLDRYETLEQYGYGHQIMRNMLQVNNGNGSFSEIGWLAGVAATDWSWSSLFADFDNDGYKDIFISNGIRRDMTDSEYIQFKRDTIELVQKTGDPYVTAQTMQKWLDRMPQVKVHNYMFKNTGKLRFNNVSMPWGFERKTFSCGTVYSDLDLDGDLDLIINDLDSEALIYRNDAEDFPNHNYIQFVFEGSDKNVFGIGARVELYTKNMTQFNEVKVSRGFLSSVEPVLHFGVGGAPEVDSAKVIWPDGKTQVLKNVKSNQRIKVRYSESKIRPKSKSVKKAAPWLQEYVPTDFKFGHVENTYNDFEIDRLLPHKLSSDGPALSVADVNGDGLDDFYCGGAKGYSGVLFLQIKNGQFKATDQTIFATDSAYEDTASLFLDTDGDTDQDLIVVSGGSEQGSSGKAYQARYYVNNGKGIFTKEEFPVIDFSSSCIKSSDFDRDGDLDLFIGGRVVPGQYGKNPRSYLFKNNMGKFEDVTAQYNKELAHIGMVTDATWVDLNNDQFPELIVTGEWMPITIFQNNKGKNFTDVTAKWGLDKSNGWWNCISQFDADGDGDIDLVTGNLGLNSLLKATAENPMDIFVSDFDQNGSSEAVICSYIDGESWPLPRKEVLIQQIPSLKKKFVRFEKYSKATIQDIFSPDQLSKAIHKQVFTLSSTLWINNGKTFEPKDLPIEAQVAPVNAIMPVDLNADGLPDLVLAGNNFGVQVELGRYDAGNGLLLMAAKEEDVFYKPLTINESGFYTPQVVKHLTPITNASKKSFIVANNNANLQFFEIKK